MKLTEKLRSQLRLQNSAFIILLLIATGLIAFISQRYTVEADWTTSKRNTLSEASQKLLESLDRFPVFTVYATEEEHIRKPVNELLRRYQRAQPAIRINFVNPELEPDQVRELGITVNGEIVIELDGRQEQVSQPTEQNITNAIQRIARSSDRWLLFIDGHGERKPEGVANHDLGEWGKQLQAKGIKFRRLNLIETPVVPRNTAAIVIASPQVDFLPGEAKAVQEYIEQGGNLLWLVEPGDLHGLQDIAQLLGLEFLPGVIVDPNTQLMGINDPRFAIVSQYSQHALTSDINAVTVFPQARGIKPSSSENWEYSVILQTTPKSWSETGTMAGQIELNPGSDVAGPLSIGLALSRNLMTQANETSTQTPQSQRKQRVVVIGDGDFLSNTYLGNGANLKLGLNIANWLAYDDRFITIPVKTSPDLNIELTSTAKAVIAFAFLILLPSLLAGTGAFIWLRRRKR